MRGVFAFLAFRSDRGREAIVDVETTQEDRMNSASEH
jgi:hypothetical protein